MAEFKYGPVELYLVGFEGEAPAPDTLQALGDLADSGLIRILDFVLISKSDDGEITVIEIEDDDFPLDLYEVGIAGEEDIEEFAELIEPGGSAALIALELLYARKLAESVAASGAVVLSAERIPAPIVNAVMDAAEEA